ncbi:MAG: SRPBCC family protein [Bacteroidota bacterium]
MKALKVLLGIIGLLILAFLLIGLIAPKDIHIERSILIDAPQKKIFPYLRYFDSIREWSPWVELDPNMTVSVQGTDGQVGSVYVWEGNEQVGKGSQEITAVEENESVTTHMTITEPWQSESDITLKAEKEGAATKVSWIMTGKNAFVESVFMFFIDLDADVGGNFEKGLDKLKKLVEKELATEKRLETRVEEVEFPGKTFLGIRKKIAMGAVQQFYAEQMPSLFEACQQKEIQIAGMPGGLFYSWDEAQGQTDMVAAIPVAEGSKAAAGAELIQLPAGRALLINHYGAPETTIKAHEAADAYLKAHQLEQKWPVIEEYVTDPAQEPDTSLWLTKVYYLL